MTGSVRHQGTEPPNPHGASPSQQEPLGEWNKVGEGEPLDDQDVKPEEVTRGRSGQQDSKLAEEPLPPQD